MGKLSYKIVAKYRIASVKIKYENNERQNTQSEADIGYIKLLQ